MRRAILTKYARGAAVAQADGAPMTAPDGSQDAVLADGVLPDAPDPRAALGAWFRALRPGGHLVLGVDRGRHSPASLLMLIEDAIDPAEVRVRVLEEDEQSGIVAVLQRVAAPVANPAFAELPAVAQPGRYYPVLPDAGGPVLAIEPGAAIATVLVLKLDHRGDFLLAEPACRTLRRHFPAARLVLLCGPWNVAAAEALGVFDEVVPAGFFAEVVGTAPPGRDGTALVLAATEALRRRTWDVAVDLRLDSDTRPLLMAFEARYRAGFGTALTFPFLDIALPFDQPGLEDRAYRRLLRPERFNALSGRHDGLAIIQPRASARAQGELLIFGPYEDLQPGIWTLELLLSPEAETTELAFDVVSHFGQQTHAIGTVPVRQGSNPTIRLVLEEAAQQLELRLFTGRAGPLPPFRFMGVLASKAGTLPTMHQQDLQALLAELVGLRLRQPVATTVIAA